MVREASELLISEILSYLREKPDASDTLEGIARFWIVRHSVDVSLRHIEHAVKRMVADGLLLERQWPTETGGATRPHYRLNSARTREIQDLLLRNAKR
jgi:hypothetical protein